MDALANINMSSCSSNQELSGISAIQKLDLDAIKIKLMDGEEGEGWTRVQADTVERWYKRYLVLNLKFPSSSIVPNKLIDTFWHYHILDTMKYADDCQNIFGRFLHHFPYFGMRSAQDANDLKQAYSATEQRFLEEFGEPLSELLSSFGPAGSAGSAKCSAGNCRSCKNSLGNIMEERPHFKFAC